MATSFQQLKIFYSFETRSSVNPSLSVLREKKEYFNMINFEEGTYNAAYQLMHII